MSIDGMMCRVCLAPQRSSRFNCLFGNNGTMVLEIFLLTGLKILEYENCPALICQKCTGELRKAVEFRSSILLSNERFRQIYKLCRHKNFHPFNQEEEEENEEFEIAVKSEPNDEINALNFDFLAPDDDDSSCCAMKAEVFIEEAEDPFLKIKDEPATSSNTLPEFSFDDLPDDLLLVLDDDHDFEEEEEESSEEVQPPAITHESKKRGRKESLQTFLCTACGYKSCSELDRQEHIATVHSKKKRKRTYVHVVGDRDWMCSYCGKNFSTKYDSIQHRKVDHRDEEESCMCRFCGKQFSQSLHLRIHIKFTHLEKRFMCPKCGLKFGNPEAFKAHMKLENNERDFVCEICSSSFILRHQLIYHMRKHTGDRRFACDYCGFRFLTKTMLKKHINVVHLKIRPFQCITCNQTFSMKHHLKGHINRVHLQLFPQ